MCNGNVMMRSAEAHRLECSEGNYEGRDLVYKRTVLQMLEESLDT